MPPGHDPADPSIAPERSGETSSHEAGAAGSRTVHVGVRRHRAEIPLLLVGVVVLVAAIPIISWLVVEAAGAWWLSIILGAVASLYLARGMLNASERANSVLITEHQFPEVHERIVRFAGEFGLQAVPDAFMVQQGGTLNAFASKHYRTNFIRVNADIFEVGTLEVGPRPRDPEVLDFIIAHEIGHVAASHVTYWYSLISGFVFYVPFLGAALSRAKEYTADNYGYAAAPGGATRGIALLSGGKYLYRSVDPAQFVERARSDRGPFLWFANALSTHPILTKRLEALEDRSRPGKLF
jgi:Zn-dependent protease with chaperone function